MSPGLDIRVRFAGARAAQQDADKTGKSVRGIGRAEQDTARKGRLAELSMKGVERSTHRLWRASRLLLGVTGIGGLAFGLREVVHATISAQTEQAKLQRTMANAHLPWRQLGEQVEQTSARLAERKGFSRGEVEATFGSFIRTTGQVGKSWRATGLAFDVARTKNISLTQSQNVINRAMLGSFIALKKLGVGVKPVTTNTDLLRASTKHATVEQVRHAKALDQQATSTQALAALQRKFHGQSDTYARTAEGRIAQARASIEVAQEQIGAVLLPYVARAAQKIALLAQAFVKNWPEIKQRISVFVKGTRAVLGPMVDWMGAHRHVVEGFALSIGGLVVSLRLLSRLRSGQGALGMIGRMLGLARGGKGVVGRALAQRGSTPANPLFVAIVRGGGGAPSVVKGAEKAGKLALAGRVLRGGVRGGIELGAPALIASGIAAYKGPRYLSGPGAKDSRGVAQAKADRQVMEDPHRTRALLSHRLVKALGSPSLSDVNAAAWRAGQWDPDSWARAGGDTIIHTHVHLDGREIAAAVHRAATRKLGLR
jgi:hypothetical protein